MAAHAAGHVIAPSRTRSVPQRRYRFNAAPTPHAERSQPDSVSSMASSLIPMNSWAHSGTTADYSLQINKLQSRHSNWPHLHWCRIWWCRMAKFSPLDKSVWLIS